LFAVLAIPFFSGCVGVPTTTVTGTLSGQPFKIVSPKDSDLVGLDIKADQYGVVHVHIDKLTARMSPDVVASTAAGQSQIIQATGATVSDAANKAIAAYLQSQGIPKPNP
jgi:hypothetical protein